MERHTIDALLAPITFFKNRALVHAAFITVVALVFIVSSIGQTNTKEDNLIVIFDFIEILVFSYIFTWLLIPKLLYRSKYVSFALVSLLLICLFSYSATLRIQYIYADVPDIYKLFWTSSISSFVLYFFMVTGLKVGKDLIIRQYDTEQIFRKNSEQELSFLKSQISPHFLLNTLNNLYGLSVINSPSLPSLILQLSDLLRFTVYNTKNELVPLQEELRYLNDYVSLQKIRLNNPSQLVSNIPLETPHKGFVLPMVCVVFIENAFKHGLNIADENAFNIKLDLQILDNEVIFTSSNYYESNASQSMGQATDDGIGMENTLRRLDLIYGHKLSPIIEDKNNHYSITIKLPIHGTAQMPHR